MHSSRLKIYGEVILFNKLNVRQRRVWYVEECLENAVCSSEFLPYHPIKILPEFLYQVLLCDKTTVDFENMSTGTSNSQKRITPSDFLDYKIFLPEKDEQQAIAQVLSDMDSEIEQFEKKLAKYQQIKQSMMQAAEESDFVIPVGWQFYEIWIQTAKSSLRHKLLRNNSLNWHTIIILMMRS